MSLYLKFAVSDVREGWSGSASGSSRGLPASLPLDFGHEVVHAVPQHDGSAVVEVPEAEHPFTVLVLVQIADIPARGVGSTLQFVYDRKEASPSRRETTSERPSDKPTSDQPNSDEPTPAEPTP